jgi:hypothetical protein
VAKPTSSTHTHHIVHWADGGPTNPDDIAMLCATHHLVLHERHWRIELQATRRGRTRLLHHHRPQHQGLSCNSGRGAQSGTRSPGFGRYLARHLRHCRRRRTDRGPQHPRTAQRPRPTRHWDPAARTGASQWARSTTRYSFSKESTYSRVISSSSWLLRNSSSLGLGGLSRPFVSRSLSTQNWAKARP